MIQIQGLSFAYPGASTPTLSDVGLGIPKNSSSALLGPNGAGKTTLVSLLAGLLPLQAGEVTIDGLDVRKHRRDIQQFLSLVPQEYAFYPKLSCRENLSFFAGIQGLKGQDKTSRIAEAVDICGLEQAIDQRAEQCSGGLRRRLNLAIALLNRPRLLILDEPTVGVDPQSRNYIVERLKRLRGEGVTLLYTSHMLDEVQRLCEELIVIDHGKLLLQETMRDALSRHRSGIISATLATPASSELLAKLKPGHVQDNYRMQWQCDPAETIRKTTELLSFIEQDNNQLQQLSAGCHQLEDLFLALTEPDLRD